MHAEPRSVPAPFRTLLAPVDVPCVTVMGGGMVFSQLRRSTVGAVPVQSLRPAPASTSDSFSAPARALRTLSSTGCAPT
jgi:hypothetical protein